MGRSCAYQCGLGLEIRGNSPVFIHGLKIGGIDLVYIYLLKIGWMDPVCLSMVWRYEGLILCLKMDSGIDSVCLFGGFIKGIKIEGIIPVGIHGLNIGGLILSL